MITPQRLVSLVPSLTELLFDLDLDAEIVGLTRFCVHPADRVKEKTVVGGTKNVHIDRVASLAPTLILASKEENTKADVEALQSRFPVLLTDVMSYHDALTMIATVGERVGRPNEALRLVDQLGAAFASLPPQPRGAVTPRVAYLIWREPWMVAASGTFIHAMLQQAGFANAFAQQSRYPVVSPEAIRAAKPDVIMLSSEPYPFREKHLVEWAVHCPEARVLLVDGEMFSWYGSRMLQAAPYFHRLWATLG